MMTLIELIVGVIVIYGIVSTLGAIGRAHRVANVMKMFDNVVDTLVACDAVVTARKPGYVVLALPSSSIVILAISDVLQPVTCASTRCVSALIPLHMVKSPADIVRTTLVALHQLHDECADDICNKFNSSVWRKFAKPAPTTVS